VTVCDICGMTRSNRESDPHGMWGHHEFKPRETPAESAVEPVADEPVATRRDAAAILGLCQFVKKQIGKIEDAAKAVADVSFPDEKVAGVYAGRVVSHTYRGSRKPREPFTIKDEAAFVAWVAERWPSEITAAIRKSFLDNVLIANATEHGGFIIDDQGEVCEHAELAEPVQYIATYVDKNAAEHLQPLLAVSLAELPAFIEGAN